MNQNTQSQIARLRKWLLDSFAIMQRIESESVHSQRDIHRVGMEWAGTLSRLEELH